MPQRRPRREQALGIVAVVMDGKILQAVAGKQNRRFLELHSVLQAGKSCERLNKCWFCFKTQTLDCSGFLCFPKFGSVVLATLSYTRAKQTQKLTIAGPRLGVESPWPYPANG